MTTQKENNQTTQKSTFRCQHPYITGPAVDTTDLRGSTSHFSRGASIYGIWKASHDGCNLALFLRIKVSIQSMIYKTGFVSLRT